MHAPAALLGWNDCLEGRRLFVLLDVAGFERGLDELPDGAFARVECLFGGDLTDELRDVAPYLAEPAPDTDASAAAISDLMRRDLAVVAVAAPQQPELPFEAAHRHFRKLNVVYGPDGNPMFFRYADPRVLLHTLPVLDDAQRDQLLGPFEALCVCAPGGTELLRLARDSVLGGA